VEPKAHWEGIYSTKRTDEVSWFAAHLAISLELVRFAAPDKNARIIDVGGGASTLVDYLLDDGYTDVTVLDISDTAIKASQQRLGTT
jgi:2-polyprenyl-3-methyl-5-hydroxy-6-metoxy-1,4-benzoquinol methylase